MFRKLNSPHLVIIILLRFGANANLVKESRIKTRGKWIAESADVTACAGKTIDVRVEADLNSASRRRGLGTTHSTSRRKAVRKAGVVSLSRKGTRHE